MRQRGPELRQRTASGRVQDQVEASPAGGEVLARVIDDVVGADRSDQVQLRRAAHAGDLGAERLRDLHGERADAARGADDEHPLARSEPSLVAQPLERRAGRDRDGGGLLEREVGGLWRDPGRAGARVLGEGAGRGAEDLVAGRESGDVRAGGLHAAGEIASRDAVLRLAEPVAHDTHEIRLAGHEVPDAGVDAGGVDANEHLAGGRHRPVDVVELEDLVCAVPVLDDRLHRSSVPP